MVLFLKIARVIRVHYIVSLILIHGFFNEDKLK